jgi:hypothetical protein
LLDNGHIFEDRLLNRFSGLEQTAELFPLCVLNFGPTEDLLASRRPKGDLLKKGVTKVRRRMGFSNWSKCRRVMGVFAILYGMVVRAGNLLKDQIYK